MLRTPPDILITTPESLFLLLTSQARETLRGIETVIVDEVHAVAGTKRGAHLALSLERLERLVERAAPADRALRHAAAARGDRALRRGHGREIELVDAGMRKELDLEVVVPLEDMRELGVHRRALGAAARRRRPDGRPASSSRAARSGRRSTRRSSSSSGAPLDDRLRQQPPPGRAARAAAERARRGGDRARAPRLARPRAADRGRGAAEGGADPVPRRDLVARARDRHGRGRPGHPGREPEVGRARATARRPSRARAPLGLARAGSSRSSGPTCSSRPSSRRRCARARSRRRAFRGTRSTCSRSRSSRSARTRRSRSTSCTSSSRRAYPFAELSRAQLENVLDMLAGRYPSDEFAELRPRIVWDRTAGVVRGRTGARRLAVTNAGTIPDRGLFGVFLVGRRRSRRRARRGDGLRGARGADLRARRLDLADRGDHARPRARLAGSGRARRRSVLEGRGGRPPGGARRADRPRGSRARRAGRRRRDRARRAASTTSTSAPRETSSPSCASRRRRPASCPPTARSSWSASATRSATGGSAS